MAQMFPDSLPSRATTGEERTFGVLKKLPEDYIVYYEPMIGNRYPDFVVICPDLGLMVIEVKGWRPSDIVEADRNSMSVREQRRAVRRDHPLRQARKYMFELMDVCRTHPDFEKLLQKGGEHENRFIFPFGHFAILSNITAEQLRNHSLGDLTSVFPPGRVITRDTLLDWEGFSRNRIRGSLKEFFDPFWEISKLSGEQVKILRAIIHPEIVVSPAPSEVAGRKGGSGAFDLRVLDLKQERAARLIGKGHHVLHGVVGSGKTVLLISRAKMFHDAERNARILVLCYNVCLAAYLQKTLEEHRSVEVLHFHKWANRVGIRWQRDEDDEDFGRRILDKFGAGYAEGHARSYDAILIDEGQDFSPSWFKCAVEALKDPDDGDLLIVADGTQALYHRHKVRWKEVGVHAVGRGRSRRLDLDKNYRNSREIVALARDFAREVTDEDEEDTIRPVAVDPSKSRRRTGYYPILVRCRSRLSECDKIRGIVEGLLRGKWRSQELRRPLRPEEIGILYRMYRKNDPEFAGALETLRANLEELAPVLWLNESSADRYRVCDPGIKIQTIHASKGLQYRAVIVMWADLMPATFPKDDLTEDERLKQEIRLMYVAMTRAEDFLAITCTGSSAFTVDIAKHAKK